MNFVEECGLSIMLKHAIRPTITRPKAARPQASGDDGKS
jgi:hypothetical protein